MFFVELSVEFHEYWFDREFKRSLRDLLLSFEIDKNLNFAHQFAFAR